MLQREREFATGRDPQLAVDLSEVELDRLGGQKQAGRGLLIGIARSDQAGNLELSGSQLVRKPRVAWADLLAGRRQLVAGPGTPRVRIEALEDLEGCPKRGARRLAFARPAQPLATAELDPSTDRRSI